MYILLSLVFLILILNVFHPIHEVSCKCQIRVPYICPSGDVLIKSVLVFAISLGIAIWWIIVRNER